MGERDLLKREIDLDGVCRPLKFSKNVVSNTKYTLLSFIPVVLFNQFKYFFNMYFLLLAVSQFFDIFKVGSLQFTFTFPLYLIIILVLAKESYDDYGRYKRD